MKNQRIFNGLVCLLSLLFVISCSYKPKEAEALKEFAAMLAKKDKLAALPTTEKLAKKPEIKGSATS